MESVLSKSKLAPGEKCTPSLSVQLPRLAYVADLMRNHSDLCLQMSSPAILSDRIDAIWDIMQRNDAR